MRTAFGSPSRERWRENQQWIPEMRLIPIIQLEMVVSISSIFQKDYDAYNERVSEAIGRMIVALLLIGAIVWLIKRFRKR